MTKYFKPRKDVSFSSCLLPQKIEGNRSYHYASEGINYKYWHENYSIDWDALYANFTVVETEAEATEGY